MADEILEQYFEISRPWDFPVVDVNQLVRQTNSEECVAAEGSSAAAAGGGGDSGGGSSAEDAILCFEGDSLVEMADGSFKKIKDVQIGDFVSTGMGGDGKGPGLVTKALRHPVNQAVSVAVVETAQGELVGTPDHPIFYQDNWVEMQHLESELGVGLEVRHIESFYNLEVDGNILEEDEASHSYVVNGITASGLGDHAELNRRFPRQQFFISKAE